MYAVSAVRDESKRAEQSRIGRDRIRQDDGTNVSAHHVAAADAVGAAREAGAAPDHDVSGHAEESRPKRGAEAGAATAAERR